MLLAFGASAPAGAPTDASGHIVTVSDSSRIVAIGGAVTEILYALGLEHRIVAVDSTSTFPKQALAEKKNVGYMRQLSPEGVLSVGPSLVLAIDGSGPKETIAVLKSSRVPFVHIPDRFTGEGIVEKIRVIAQATGVVERGECLAKMVSADLDALARLHSRIEQPRRLIFVLSLMGGRPMVAGRATAADGIINLAGAKNAIADYEGYKLVNDEAIIAARPEVVLAMERAGFQIDAKAAFNHPAFATTPAAASSAFVSMDGLYLLGFGPRTARAARDLSVTLYPSLADIVMPSASSPMETSCRP